jgi:hypothetical protein
VRRSSTDLFAQDRAWLGHVLAPRESKITPAVLTLDIWWSGGGVGRCRASLDCEPLMNTSCKVGQHSWCAPAAITRRQANVG